MTKGTQLNQGALDARWHLADPHSERADNAINGRRIRSAYRVH